MSNIVFAFIGYAFIIAFCIQILFFPRAGNLIIDLGAAGVIACLIYLFWVRPKLLLDDEGLRIVNPLNSVYVPYCDIQDLETKWTLLVVHNGNRTRVWAAPASGRYAWAASRVDQLNYRDIQVRQISQETVPASQSETSYSGAAAIRIRRKMTKH